MSVAAYESGPAAVWGVLAEFETPDQLLEAAEARLRREDIIYSAFGGGAISSRAERPRVLVAITGGGVPGSSSSSSSSNGGSPSLAA